MQSSYTRLVWAFFFLIYVQTSPNNMASQLLFAGTTGHETTLRGCLSTNGSVNLVAFAPDDQINLVRERETEGKKWPLNGGKTAKGKPKCADLQMH